MLTKGYSALFRRANFPLLINSNIRVIYYRHSMSLYSTSSVIGEMGNMTQEHSPGSKRQEFRSIKVDMKLMNHLDTINLGYLSKRKARVVVAKRLNPIMPKSALRLTQKANKPIIKAESSYGDTNKATTVSVPYPFRGKGRPVYRATSPHDPLPSFTSTPPEVAIIGRSNVGKSTLLNALVGFNNSFVQKAAVSDKPGETKDLTFYKIGNTPIIQNDSDNLKDIAISAAKADYSAADKGRDTRKQAAQGPLNARLARAPALILVDMPGYGFSFMSEQQKTLSHQLSLRYLLSNRVGAGSTVVAVDTFGNVATVDNDDDGQPCFGKSGTVDTVPGKSRPGQNLIDRKGKREAHSGSALLLSTTTAAATALREDHILPSASPTLQKAAAGNGRGAVLKRVLLLLDGRHGIKLSDITFLRQLQEVASSPDLSVEDVLDVDRFPPIDASRSLRDDDDDNDDNDCVGRGGRSNGSYSDKSTAKTKIAKRQLAWKLQIVLTKCDLVERLELCRRITQINHTLHEKIPRLYSSMLPTIALSAKQERGVLELKRELAALVPVRRPDRRVLALNADPSDRVRNADRANRDERADRADRTDRAGRVDRAGRTDRADRTDRAGRTDHAGRAGRADRADRADRTDRADRADRTDRTDRAGRADRCRVRDFAAHKTGRDHPAEEAMRYTPPRPSPPSRPSRPSMPSKPSKPSRPSTSSTPSKPSRPSTPSRLSRPSTPSSRPKLRAQNRRSEKRR